MYTSFHIKNFRGFEDLELNDLARINLVAGRNNVGKTALLEALYLHARGNNPQEILNLNQVRGLEFSLASDARLIFPGLDISLKAKLEGVDQITGSRTLTLRFVTESDELAKLNVTITADSSSNGLSSLSENVQVIALDYEQASGESQSTAYMTRSRDRSVSYTGVLQSPVKIAFILFQKSPAPEDFARRFSNLELAGQQDFLIEILHILEPSLKRISILYVGNKPSLWADIGTARLPVNLLGDGLNRLIHVVATIVEYKKGVVLIDEIENGLHHSVQIEVWKAIAKAARDFDVQIFATTHSLEMIRAAHEVFRDQEPYDFRLHRLDRSKKTGEIYATTYDKESMEAAVELSAEVR